MSQGKKSASEEVSNPLQGFQTSILEPGPPVTVDNKSANARFMAMLMASDLHANEGVICQTCNLPFLTQQQLTEHYSETSHGQPKKSSPGPEKAKGRLFK